MRPLRLPVKTVLRIVRRVTDDSRAATAIEYGLIASLIVVGLIAAIGSLGGTTGGMWNNMNAKYAAVAPK